MSYFDKFSVSLTSDSEFRELNNEEEKAFRDYFDILRKSERTTKERLFYADNLEGSTVTVKYYNRFLWDYRIYITNTKEGYEVRLTENSSKQSALQSYLYKDVPTDETESIYLLMTKNNFFCNRER